MDVVILTMNSERMLEPCLASVYRNVPVKHLIAVDGGSTDRTLEILNKFNLEQGNVKIIHDKGTRATARQKGIQSITSDWFLFVDSDVVLCNDWHQKALKHVDKDVGAVWGIEVWSTITTPATLRMFLLITMKIFELRGGTHDTLIRTDAVKGIRIPHDLHVFEDAYIKTYITKKGYRVVGCYNPFGIHYRPKEVWTFKGSLQQIIDTFRYSSPTLFFKLVLAYGFYTVYSVFQLLSNNKTKK